MWNRLLVPVVQFTACLVSRASGYWPFSHPTVSLHLFSDYNDVES